MRRNFLSVFVWITLLIVLSACSIEQQSGGGGGVPRAEADQPGNEVEIRTISPTAHAPSLTSAKGSQLRLPLVPRQEVPIPRNTPTLAAPVQPTTQIKPIQICSPLADQQLDELDEIVSDPYHPPPPGREERHHGVDFAYYWRDGRASIEGAGAQSIFAGTVAASIVNRFPYGNVVIIETPENMLPPELITQLQMPDGYSLYVLYAHLQDAPLASLNTSVDACQALGSVGRSGNAGGVHLHLEMRFGPPRQRFESLAYYKADATAEERENYLRWRVSGEFQHLDPMIVLSAP